MARYCWERCTFLTSKGSFQAPTGSKTRNQPLPSWNQCTCKSPVSQPRRVGSK
jgi:hypothetical protein